MDYRRRDAASDLHALGRLLRRARMAAGLSCLEVGVAADLTHGCVSRMENAKRHPKRPTLLRLAAALGLGPIATDEALLLAGYLPSDDGILRLARAIEARRLGAAYEAWHAEVSQDARGPSDASPRR